jgi:RNA polymerase sigma-70 factor (ECF subfamily)
MTAKQDNWPDDEALVRDIITGDRDAWEVLYKRFERLINGIAWKFTKNKADAKDLCQEIWLHLFLVLPRWKPTGLLDSWVCRVATNKSLEWLRSRGRRPDEVPIEEPPEPSQELVDNTMDPARLVEQQEVRDAVRRCLESIGKSGWALKLFMQRYSYKEISNILRSPIGTVGTWIRRGKAAMKKCLEERFPDLFS